MTWREISLPAPGRPAAVTALVTAGGGFLGTGIQIAGGARGAGGAQGAGGARDVIVWWSSDGLTWHAARLTGRGPGGPGVQQITGLSVSGGMLTGVGSTATGAGQRPVLWQTRVR